MLKSESIYSVNKKIKKIQFSIWNYRSKKEKEKLLKEIQILRYNKGIYKENFMLQHINKVRGLFLGIACFCPLKNNAIPENLSLSPYYKESIYFFSTNQKIDEVTNQEESHPVVETNQKERIIKEKLLNYLITKYSVDENLSKEIIESSYEHSKEHGIDPLITLSVIKTESEFNPTAKSSHNARGLMQILPKAHVKSIQLIGGLDKLNKPNINIKLGTKILKEFIAKGRSVENGLQYYCGNIKDKNKRYSKKVLRFYDELALLM